MSVPSSIPYKRALIVANPIAGVGRGEASARALSDGLIAAGLEVELRFTEGRGDATRLVRERDPRTEVVIAVGGDGTVAEVLSGMPRELPLALHPMGTANVMSVDLGIPRDVPGTLKLLASGKQTGLDVALVNGRLSFLVSGFGPDGSVVREVDLGRKGPITKRSYVGAVVRTLLHWRPKSMSVEIDGEQMEGHYCWILVSNVIGYAGVFRLSSKRVLDDGLWEVYLFPRGSRWALFCYSLRGIMGRLPGGDCTMRQARRVHIRSDEKIPFEIDGDYAGETDNTEIEVQPGPYTLLLP